MTFQTIPTRIDSSSELFATNTWAYQELVATLRERQQIAIDGGHGREKSIDRHHARGKVMARDRIDLVTDDNTPFLEFSTLAAWGQYNDEAPGAGIVTGIGVVHGGPRHCLLHRTRRTPFCDRAPSRRLRAQMERIACRCAPRT